MLAFFNRIVEWFKSLFWKEEMELTLVGLQNSGKTTFVNVIAVSIKLVAFSNKSASGGISPTLLVLATPRGEACMYIEYSAYR